MPAQRLRYGMVASFIGRGWSAFVALAFVPLYIRFMGVEAYGLVGIYITMLWIGSILDLGMSGTLNRELARLSVAEDEAQAARNLVRSLELCYWAVSLLCGAGVALASPLIATGWIQAGSIPLPTVQMVLMIVGLILAFQLPLTFYSNGLMGLQQQVVLNGLNVAVATVRSLGAVLILWLISPTVIAFFLWQAAVSAAHTLLMAWLLWRSLPGPGLRPRLDLGQLRSVWRFAAGLTGTSILAVLLTQVDKIVLSRLLPLELFGYYSLASTVANGLYNLISPIFTVIFPSFSRLVAAKDELTLRRLYHQSAQLMSVVVLPVAVVVASFSQEILLIWTGDQRMAEQAHLLVSLLIIGTALNGLMNIPYALQLAYGWTSLSFYQNLVSVVLLVPLIFWAVHMYGAVGAAMIWVVLNVGYIIVGVQIMHTRLFFEEKGRWYWQDVGLPLLGTLLVTMAARAIFPTHLVPAAVLVGLALAFGAAAAVTVLITPYTRHLILRTVLRSSP